MDQIDADLTEDQQVKLCTFQVIIEAKTQGENSHPENGIKVDSLFVVGDLPNVCLTHFPLQVLLLCLLSILCK